MTPRSPQHAAALEYVGRGWFVHPLIPGKKEPATKNGYLDASNDPAQIDAWWSSNPAYNIGIAVAPSGLVVLDVDVGKKKPKVQPDGTMLDQGWKQGRKSAGEIEHELTPTLLASGVTLGEDGRPGVHAWYTRPPDVPPARVIGFKDGLDIIGDGYIVAAPSYFAENGRYYQWTQLQALAPLPPFLQHVARTPKTKEVVDKVGTPIAEGGRNNAMFKLGCVLRDTGIGAEALARAMDAENQQRFNPPLDTSELAVIVNSVLNTVQVRRDVAADAVVSQEIQQIFAPPSRSEWIENVSLVPQPPMVFYDTGFEGLNRLLNGGFATRQVVGIIGPPSAGKSALVGHWLEHLSKQRPVLHCSLELPRHELFVRYAAHKLEFPWVEGVKGKIDQGLMANAVRGLRIRLLGAEDVDRNNPFGSIAMEAEKIRQECGIAPIIAIDYIQLMARGSGSSELRSKVGDLTMQCRQLAQMLDTVVIGVLTTSRATYGNKKVEEQVRAANDPTAYLAAAKESGDIEFDCATILYLDVDKLAEGATKPARIAVARVRGGEVGFVGVRARLDVGKFWEDNSALGEFAAEERAMKRDAEDVELACKAVLDAVAAMPGRPWRDHQARAASMRGVNRSMADRARNKLIGDGVLEQTERYDPEDHRKLPGGTLIIKQMPPNLAQEPQS